MRLKQPETRWWPPLILFVIATVVAIAGLGYGVVMVGVPTPHATSAIAATEARSVDISMWVTLVGVVLGVAAVIWLGVLVWIRHLRQSTLA
jgi:hypothetical protein